jgi:membrane-associated PAP2 superfamily phosphatase
MKTILTVIAVAIIAVVLWDMWRPLPRWTPLLRLRVRILALSAVAVPVVTSLLKQRSASHCPWDLTMYGGAEPYVRLLEVLPAGAHAGHCLPAGHASSALWLVAIGVFWLPARPRMALAMAAVGLSLGVALGWIQQLRGAHFLTHTLWSIWIACAVVLAVTVLLPRLRRRTIDRS